MVYHIETETRIYDHVESKEQFQTVRENWTDTSKVVNGFRWNSESSEWEEMKATRNW